MATQPRISCRAPKGQSQPQNRPRPQRNRLTKVKLQRMKISGSIRKMRISKPSHRVCSRVKIFTTDSWPWA
ncbi:hypothetical protein D3C80_1397860 [compost metagenome]